MDFINWNFIVSIKKEKKKEKKRKKKKEKRKKKKEKNIDACQPSYQFTRI